MSYPAIVYKRVRINTTNADDLKYLHKPLYEVTLIDKNPESEFVYKILELPYCSDANEFITDNLYHHVFNLYF